MTTPDEIMKHVLTEQEHETLEHLCSYEFSQNPYNIEVDLVGIVERLAARVYTLESMLEDVGVEI